MLKGLNIDFWNFEYQYPDFLWLLLLIPVYIVWYLYKSKIKNGNFKLSIDIAQIRNLDGKLPQVLNWLTLFSFGIGACFIILALAGPNKSGNNTDNEYSQGIDIVLAIDISGSMMAQDFLPNRLEAAKSVAKDFIDGRKNDRIGLVAYEGEAYTACPATKNHAYLKECVDNLHSGLLETGTAIGTGLGTAVTRLRTDSISSKVIILLTDGESNRGKISPLEAAELAKNKNIRVYTIGVGSEQNIGGGFSNVFGSNPLLSSIDEKTLRKIAELTEGEYFRAKDKNSLRDIYNKIEDMETRRLEENILQNTPPIQPTSFIVTGLILILLSWVSRKIFFETIE